MAVGGHGEDEQQLLEIGTVGLGVAVGDGRRAAPSNASPRGATVAAAKADRGAVVVKLIKAQAEALPDRHDHLGQQRCAVGVKESIQSAPEPVIAEVLHLVGVDAEHAAGKAVHGLLLAVDRFALDDERAQQYAQGTGMRDGAPCIGGHMPVQHLFQADAFDEVVDKRQGSQALALKIEASTVRRAVLHVDHSVAIINDRMQKVKQHGASTRDHHQARSRANRSHSTDPQRDRLPVLRHVAATHEGLR